VREIHAQKARKDGGKKMRTTIGKTTIELHREDTVKSLIITDNFAFMNFESGLKIEMSRSQIEAIVLEYKKSVALDARVQKVLANAKPATLGEMDDEELAEYLEPTI
jgi:hypothetical protein